MHAAEREKAILELLEAKGFITFRELEQRLVASPATIRRDLERLDGSGVVVRVHGGAKLAAEEPAVEGVGGLSGVPFHQNIARNPVEKERIGRAAAKLCSPGEGVMIDGGSTTLQMCPHLNGLGLQVLTNSLHIASALLQQSGTRITVPGGVVFPEQNIILSPPGNDLMPRFHAPKLFMGAAAVGPQGLMQADVILVTAERRLIDRAERVIVLVDSSKFRSSSGHIVCGLEEVDIIISDMGLEEVHRQSVREAGVELILV
jgi:DeoR/GlpR family transcriptional regulator of sugar metabolism